MKGHSNQRTKIPKADAKKIKVYMSYIQAKAKVLEINTETIVGKPFFLNHNFRAPERAQAIFLP